MRQDPFESDDLGEALDAGLLGHVEAAHPALAEDAGDRDQAREAFARVVERVPDHPANRQLAALLAQIGDAAGAITCWRRVVTITGNQDLEAVTALGIALSTDGQHSEAVDLLSDVA